jgi:co-chaperonin GroES (HSP10)
MKKTKISRCLWDSVLIKELVEKVNIKGFIIPEGAEGSFRKCEGIVLKIGPNVHSVIPGDIVIFGKNATSTLHERYGDNLSIVKESNIFIILKEEEEEADA